MRTQIKTIMHQMRIRMDNYIFHIEGKGMNAKIEIKGKEDFEIVKRLLKIVKKNLEKNTIQSKSVGGKNGN